MGRVLSALAWWFFPWAGPWRSAAIQPRPWRCHPSQASYIHRRLLHQGCRSPRHTICLPQSRSVWLICVARTDGRDSIGHNGVGRSPHVCTYCSRWIELREAQHQYGSPEAPGKFNMSTLSVSRILPSNASSAQFTAMVSTPISSSACRCNQKSCSLGG